jgi:hypothetical protein
MSNVPKGSRNMMSCRTPEYRMVVMFFSLWKAEGDGKMLLYDAWTGDVKVGGGFGRDTLSRVLIFRQVELQASQPNI